jgi:hypothetical protein
MNCPNQDSILLDGMGELTVNESKSLRAHLTTCPTCQARQREAQRLLEDVTCVAGTTGPDTFTQRLQHAIRAPGLVPNERKQLPSWSRFILAAAVVLLPTALILQSHFKLEDEATTGDPPGIFIARGGPSHGVYVNAEVLLVRNGKLNPLKGQSLRASDALAVRVSNPTQQPVHLLAFARDAAHEIHWLYPAHVHRDGNPVAVVVAPGTKDRLLEEVVEPENPTLGPMRIVTVAMPTSLTVKQAETRLTKATDHELAELFQGAIVQQWQVTWGTKQ